jgi:hypothetical protein
MRTKDTNFSQTKPKPSNISKNTSQKRPETFVNLIDIRNMCDVAEEVIQVDANFESYHDNKNIDATEADSTENDEVSTDNGADATENDQSFCSELNDDISGTP